eukprot:CAMPEP_0179153662 /NCGR_PEP_ID=MMETSP0796-20121207/74736_1 /TAXON_ID=73915 /ORGANISM="Pyrodinium bahamense, Strain pbaha01" /LENGTH=368 /DNA_ID=CAMNT_0020854961 /DNA_START=57 /DNA_END=1163 /DNA_ORIENTATION=+
MAAIVAARFWLLFALIVGLATPTERPLPMYNESEAILHYRYALASFCDGNAIETWDCGTPCRNAPIIIGSARFLRPGESFGVQGYVALLPPVLAQGPGNHCIVAFRGTQPMNLKNMQADYLFLMTEWPDGGASWCPGCLAHQGFAGSYAEVRPALFSALRDLKCQRVSLTGHSLGGAVATLASMDLRGGVNMPVVAVWTYGKPRVGNDAFVEAYVRLAREQGIDPPMWRVVHYHDIIPRINLYSFPWKPRHEPLEVYYYTENSFVSHVCESTPQQLENPKCMLGTPVLEWSYPDHMKYLRVPFDLPSICGFSMDYGGEHELAFLGFILAAAVAVACRGRLHRRLSTARALEFDMGKRLLTADRSKELT